MKYKPSLTNKYSTHSQMLSKISSGSNVLDIGCAQGYLDEYLLKELKCEVYGIDLEKEAAKKAKKFCKDVLIGDVEEILKKGFPWKITFDYILLGDILEHLIDPEAALRRLKTYLKPNGVIIISLPNIAYLPVRLNLLFGKFEYTNVGIMDSTHLKFFTRNSMNKMFESCGLKLTDQKGVGHLSGIFGLIGSKLDQLMPTLSAVQIISVVTKK